MLALQLMICFAEAFHLAVHRNGRGKPAIPPTSKENPTETQSINIDSNGRRLFDGLEGRASNACYITGSARRSKRTESKYTPLRIKWGSSST